MGGVGNHRMVRRRVGIRTIGLILLVWMVAGCENAREPRWTLSDETRTLPVALQEKIEAELTRACGTAKHPRLLGDNRVPAARLECGAVLFHQLCASCHGTTGDGNTKAAEFLSPVPRNFRQGFKFISTPYGSKPVPDDLRRTIRDGCPGTGMPSFDWLSDEDISDLVTHVIVLAQRGELEQQLTIEADFEEELAPETVREIEERIASNWKQAEQHIVAPISPLVPYSDESVARGREAFMTEATGCYRCHGPDGRGYTVPDPTRPPDAPPIRAPDLTSGMLAGGNRPIDLYRRIYAGINTTPMPSYALRLENRPQMVWDLVNFVQFLENSRREALRDLQQSN